MGLFSKNETFLGVDIGANGIKVVELRKNKNRPQLWTYGMADEPLDIHLRENVEKTPEDLLSERKVILEYNKKDLKKIELEDPRIDRYAELLKKVLRASKIVGKKVTASLPVSYVFHAVVTLPKVEDKEIDHLVKAEVKKALPRPIDEMQVVYQKILESESDIKKNYLRILVTAAPKELVRFYTAIFQKAGLELQELETEAFALERSLVGLDMAIVMVVDMGAERTNFFIMNQGLPLTHRSINIGGDAFDKIIMGTLGVESEMVSQIKSDISRNQNLTDVDIFQPVLDPIIKEINYSFDIYLSQAGIGAQQPEKIILTGGASVMPFIAKKIADHFPLKVFVGDPWARVVTQEGLKSKLANIGPRMAVSIGLALRNIV